MSISEQNLPFWCQQVLDSRSHVVLDTTTTSKYGEVIEIAIIDMQGELLFHQLFQPLITLEEETARIHRITPTMLLRAPTLKQHWSDVLACLKGKHIITYNAHFDAHRIEQSAHLYGLLLPEWPFYCMMQAYANYWQAPGQAVHYPWQKLGIACNQQNVDLSNVTGIRALGDAQTTLALMQRLAEQGSSAPTYRSSHSLLPVS